MKLRRLIPLLMAAVMLLSAIQMTSADSAYGTRPQPTVTTKDRTCNHIYGEWSIISEATCLQPAREQHTCRKCGHSEWRPTGGLGEHRWGEWTVLREPAPEEPGLRQHTCSVCNATEEEEFEDKHSAVSPVTLEPEDPTIELTTKLTSPGPFKWMEKTTEVWTITNTSDETLYYQGSNFLLGTEPGVAVLEPHASATHSAEFQVGSNLFDLAKKNDGVAVTKSQVSYKNEAGKTAFAEAETKIPIDFGDRPTILLTAELTAPGPFMVDEEVTINLTVKNLCNRELIYGKSTPDMTGSYPSVLAPDASKTMPYTFTVTQEMVDEAVGTGMNRLMEFFAIYVGKEAAAPSSQQASDKAEVRVPLTTAKEVPKISLTASLIEPDMTYHVNDHAAFSLTLTNECDETLSLVGSNVFLVEGWPDKLAPYQVVSSLHWSHCITEADGEEAKANGGVHTDTIWVDYVNADKTGAHAEAECSVKVAEGKNPYKLVVFANIPAGNHEPYEADESIIFHVTATNSGCVTLKDVILYDCYAMPAGHVELAPGESHSEDFEYTVTDEDAGNGKIEFSFDAVGWDFENNKEIWADPYPYNLTTASDFKPHLTLSYSGGPLGDLKEGDLIDLKLITTNDGNVPVSVGGHSENPHPRVGYDVCVGWAANYLSPLPPSDVRSFNYSVRVTNDDISDGAVQRSFTVSYHATDDDGQEHNYVTNTVDISFPLGEKKDQAALTLTCVSTSSPGAKLGDTVYGLFTLTNTGDIPVQLTNVSLSEYPGRTTDPNAYDDMDEWVPHVTKVLQPKDSISVTQYTTVIADDLAVGKVVREICVLGTSQPESGAPAPVNSNPASMNVALTSELEYDPVEIVKTRDGDPTNPGGYQKGEPIHYTVKVTNTSDETLTNLELVDPIFKTPEEQLLGKKSALAPKDTWTVPFDYIVAAEDLSSPTLYNQAAVTYDYPLDGQTYTTHSNIVSAPLNKDGEPTIILTKSYVFDPDNGLFYTPGEKVTFTVQVKNPNQIDLAHLKVSDPLAWNEVDGTLLSHIFNAQPGYEDTLTFDYIVTYPDANASDGILRNKATAEAYTADGTYILVHSNVVEVPVGIGNNRKMLSIFKEETSTGPHDGKYALNEMIDYKVTVKNVGEFPLYNVVIEDSLNDSNPLDIMPVLNPSEVRTYTYSHKVDIKNWKDGMVVNYATADFCTDVGYGYQEISEKVVCYVGDGKKHESGGARESCVRTLVGKGAGVSEYTLKRCAEHEEIAALAQAMIDAAQNDEERLAAYQQAVILWTETMNGLYTELLNAYPDAGQAVLGSRIACNRWLSAYENMLRTRYGKSELEIAKLVTEQLTVRCIDLCYALNHAPDPKRPDSMVTGNYEKLATEAAEACESVVYTAEDGTLRLRETLCQDHAAIERATMSALVQAVSVSDVLNNGVVDYRNALSGQFAMRTRSADTEERHSLLLYQSTILDFLDRDIQLWQALYPNQPAVAAELAYAETRALSTLLCGK